MYQEKKKHFLQSYHLSRAKTFSTKLSSFLGYVWNSENWKSKEKEMEMLNFIGTLLTIYNSTF